MAAGFTIDMAHFDAFREFMNDKALAAFDGAEPVRELRYDSAIAAGHCTLDLINWLDLAAPTAGFAEPRFRLNAVRLAGVMPWVRIKPICVCVLKMPRAVCLRWRSCCRHRPRQAISDAADGRPVIFSGRSAVTALMAVRRQLHLIDVAPAHIPE